jgi:chromosomal replication initiation ATPase DnaA
MDELHPPGQMSATITNLYRLDVDGQPIGQFTRAQLISIRAEVNKILTPNCHAHADRIISAVCDRFVISQKAILGHSRKRHVCWPRQLAMHLLRERTDLAFSQIAGIFNYREHGTAIHAVEAVNDRIATDPKFRDAVVAIRTLLNSQQNAP